MKKIHWIFFVITLAMIGATAGFLFHIKGNQKLGKPGVLLGHIPLFDPETNKIADVSVILPENVPGYFSRSLPVSAMELQTLPKDTTYGKRRYWNNDGANADVSVILMGQDRTSLHKPQFCLSGQGWTIEQTEIVNVKIDRPYPYELPLLKLTASCRIKDQNGQPIDVRGIYAYWFVADKKIGIADQRMWSMMKTFLLTGTLERWAYISYFSRCYPGQEEETFKQLQHFIALSVPEFQLPTGKPLPGASPQNVQTAFK
ncbi:MAG: exosortase-associated EpsI family protein [Verrucomicrobiota bacterium]